jgi:hypothetical protein
MARSSSDKPGQSKIRLPRYPHSCGGNPCNTNCLIAMSNAPAIPRDRWHADAA